MKKKLVFSGIILVLMLVCGFFWKQHTPITNVSGQAYQMTLDDSDQLYLIFAKDKQHQVILTSFKENTKIFRNEDKFAKAYQAQEIAGKNLVYELKKNVLTLSWSKNDKISDDALILENLQKKGDNLLKGSVKASGDGNFAIFTKFNRVTLKRLD
ncbi:hypothetical protein [Ligilactobacillus sp. Marseille-Q7487]|uniref:hypothetical protein n=1 Tax=Ligilactobacillus sp. Marseille-Q7487 TaxID=3022128 RepID=UPI0024A99897|nr:hypothetical protein [Ligilactobacillus sp. Marseille-Q7487]